MKLQVAMSDCDMSGVQKVKVSSKNEIMADRYSAWLNNWN
jgi:hypothetical protein